MKFSTRTRYGLRFLIRLAACPPGQLAQLGELAREEEISAGYLEQIVRALKPLGILRTVRGASGGYALACPPDAVNLEQIFLHLEGGIAPVACLADEDSCARVQICSTRRFWESLDSHMRSFLRGMTLQDLMLSLDKDSEVYLPPEGRKLSDTQGEQHVGLHGESTRVLHKPAQCR